MNEENKSHKLCSNPQMCTVVGTLNKFFNLRGWDYNSVGRLPKSPGFYSVVVHVYDPSTKEMRQEDHKKFKVILYYM